MKNRFGRLAGFRTVLVISLLFIVLTMTGFSLSCQASVPAPAAPTPSTSPTAPSQVEVTIEGFAYNPVQITVPVGTTVIWKNNDSAPHAVTADDGSFDSGSLSRGDTFSHTFKQAGTLGYYCKFHSSMTAKVVVE